MNRMQIRCLAVVFSLAACTPGSDAARHADELMAVDAEFAGYSRDRGAAAAFDRYLADDAIHLPRQGEAVSGRVAIVDGLRALDDGWVLDWAPVHGEASVDGSFGYTWGRYALYRAATPDARQLGKYLTVWRRDAQGRWRVAADIGNQTPPVPD